MEKMDNNVVLHVCLVVRDIYKVSKNLAEIFGIEEIPIQKKGEPNNPYHKTTYHGEYSANTEWLLVFYKMGSVDLEIIQPIGEGPSIWRDYLDRHGEGLHHIGYRVNDNEEVVQFMQNKGMDIPQTGLFKNGSYAYINSEDKIGFILETIASSDS